MAKKFLVAFLTCVVMLGCLVSCSEDDPEPTVGVLKLEMTSWTAYWDNHLHVAVYPLEQQDTPIKVEDFGLSHTKSIDLNPGNYRVDVYSDGTDQSGWWRYLQIQAGKTEVIKLSREN